MTDKHEIKNAFFEHFQALFAYQTIDVEGFQKYFVDCLPRLDNHVKEALEQPISDDEVKTAIENLNPGRSPGPDGLSAALYKENKHLLVPVLAFMFNKSLDIKTLPPSCSISHTALIAALYKEKLKSVKRRKSLGGKA